MLKKYFFIFTLGLFSATAQAQFELKDLPYIYLLNERTVTVGEKNQIQVKIHRRLKILKEDAVNTIGDIRIPYNHYYGKPTLISAFTEDESGLKVEVKHEDVEKLSPKDFAGYQMYSDAREFVFSMPALKKGSIIDYTVQIDPIRSTIEGQAWDVFDFSLEVPVYTSRYEIVNPRNVELNRLEVNLPEEVETREERIWELKNIDPIHYESGMPNRIDLLPRVHLSTMKSWEPIEAWYMDLMKDKVQVDDALQKRVDGLVKDLKTRREKIEAIFAHIQENVRYVGIELGRSAYQPHASLECISNAYGDCKDQSVLLISMLQAINIKAHLALVKPKYFGSVLGEIPYPGQFNHAIVYVPSEDVWLDPTGSRLPVGIHPAVLEDAQSLIVGDGKKGLQTIPVLDGDVHVHRLKYDVELFYDGLCHVTETDEYEGRAGQHLRTGLVDKDMDEQRKKFREELEKSAGFEQMIRYDYSDPRDRSKPFRIETEYLSSTFLAKTETGFQTSLSAAEINQPLALYKQLSKNRKSRSHPWVSNHWRTEEIHLTIRIPTGFRIPRKPSSFNRSLTHGDIKMEFELKDRKLKALIRVTGKPATIKASAFTRTKTLTDRAINMASANLHFIDDYNQWLKQGKIDQALEPMLKLVESHPEDAEAQARLGSLYLSIGRVYAARKHLNRAKDLNPKRFKVYEDLAATYMAPIGNVEGKFNHHEIKRIYNQALEHVHDRKEVLNQMSRVFTFDQDGRQYSPDAPLDKATEFLDLLIGMDDRNLGAWIQKFDALVNQRKYEEADEVAVRMSEINSYDTRSKATGWFSAAILGNPDYALNLLNNTYNDPKQRLQQTYLLGSFLLRHERYQDASVIFRALAPQFGERKMLKLADLLEQMEPDPTFDMATYFKVGTPEDTARTFAVAMLAGDMDRVSRCMSKHIGHHDILRHMHSGTQRLIVRASSDRHLARLALELHEVKTNPIDDRNRVEVIWRTKPEIEGLDGQLGLNSTGLTYHMIKEGEAWKVYSIINQGPYPSLLAQFADSYLEAEKPEAALPIIEEMYSVCGRHAAQGAQDPLLCNLKEIEFASPDLRVKAHIAMGLDAYDPSQNKRKLDLLNKICKTNPDQAFLHLERAGVLAALDHRVGSAQAIQKATELEPDNQQYRYALIGAFLDSEQFDQAEKRLKEDLETSPAHPLLLALQFRLNRLRQQVEPAKEVLKKMESIDRNANRSTYFNERIDIALLENNPDELRAIEREASDMTGVRNIIYPVLHDGYLYLGEFKDALRVASAFMMTTRAALPKPHLLAAFALVALDQREEAADILSRVPNVMQDDNSMNHYNIATLSVALNNKKYALKHFEKALLRPYAGVRPYVHLNMALLRGMKKGQIKKLRKERKLLESGSWIESLFNFALDEISLKEAEAKAKSSKDPDQIRNFLCELYYYAGLKNQIAEKKEEARKSFQAALDTKAYRNFEYLQAKGMLRTL